MLHVIRTLNVYYAISLCQNSVKHITLKQSSKSKEKEISFRLAQRQIAGMKKTAGKGIRHVLNKTFKATCNKWPITEQIFPASVSSIV